MTKTITYFDSFYENDCTEKQYNASCFDILLVFLFCRERDYCLNWKNNNFKKAFEKWEKKKEFELWKKDWNKDNKNELKKITDIKQANCSDCGVFTTLFGLLRCLNKDVRMIDPLKTNDYRLKMQYLLLKLSLI